MNHTIKGRIVEVGDLSKDKDGYAVEGIVINDGNGQPLTFEMPREVIKKFAQHLYQEVVVTIELAEP